MIPELTPPERLHSAAEYIRALTDAVELAMRAGAQSTHEVLLNLIVEQTLIMDAVSVDLEWQEQ